VDEIQKIIGRVEQIPTLPQVATRLMAMMEDPHTSAKDVQWIISRDPALAMRVLRLVNSAYYGLSQRVSDLNQAVVILGFNVIRSLALSVSLFDTFRGKGEGGAFDRERFWKHSIASACIYRVLTQKTRALDVETAFVCGLLHDIGKLILDVYAQERMETILARAQEAQGTFLEAEQVLGEVTHAQVGGWILERWRFPQVLIETTRDHHQVDASSNGGILAIGRFSDYLCTVKGLVCTGSHQQAALDRTVWDALGMDKGDLPMVLGEIDREIKFAEEFLKIA
jgi:putative nucleotidyltransferase with HDIG domain